ncbi:glycosyltransferase family 2 protein [Bacteroides sp.]|uniref:glycosyltransferase n=1 Tax=Bacteroides sp. TaxID=29523 RepID=UPI00261E01B6|nr:glycosyltransferase family 2 protein [Bacteroides sp.]MDD3037756.1 glycosyltransferase family 2 protein [Bacteroides sp.]
MNIIDWILYIPLTLCVSYLLIFAIASKFYRTPRYPEAKTYCRFAVLFPAYKEDQVIVSSVRSFLEQNYPPDKFNIIVISDQMKPTTNKELSSLPIRLLIAHYTESSKARALRMAIDAIEGETYDGIIIMDADNLTIPNFLSEINKAFNNGIDSVQAHRTGKNLNTSISILDSISEEINNSFFRSGHNVLGLSAGLSGSGMAFNANWFRKNVAHLQSAGEDKELEALLLRQGIHTVYLRQLPVYDEKVEKKEAIGNQRKRWIAAQFGTLYTSLPYFPKALLQGNLDYCNKIFQWMLPPRLIQLAGVFGFTIFFTTFGVYMSLQGHEQEWQISIKWWILSFAQITAMILPIPGEMLNRRLLLSILQLPTLTITTIKNLFKLKGAYKKFIHTKHGDHE